MCLESGLFEFFVVARKLCAPTRRAASNRSLASGMQGFESTPADFAFLMGAL
jgi:hypothetical protein